MSTSSKMLSAVMIGVSCLALATRASADPKQVCSDAYDATQTLQDEGKLVEARKEALICAAEPCPGFVREDCGKWLAKIDETMPTFVFTVKDTSGNNTTAVRVTVDGHKLLEELDGTAVAVDPGRHKLRFVIPRATPIEVEIVGQRGVKNRALAVSFERKETAPLPPTAQGAASTSAPPPAQEPKHEPKPDTIIEEPTSSEGTTLTWPWISGGLGLGAAALGAISLVASGSDDVSIHNGIVARASRW